MSTIGLRSISTLVIAIASFSLTGCLATMADPDQYRCVESALRGNADAWAVEGAREVFEERCDMGDAAACSVMGVMSEVGRGMPQDGVAAVAYYEKACDGGVGRACEQKSAMLSRRLVASR